MTKRVLSTKYLFNMANITIKMLIIVAENKMK